MNRNRYIYIVIGLMLITMSASAQGGLFNGFVMTRSTFGASDMVNLSQYNSSTYGTARSVAMGGAFASLGADLSTMNINPAGLGMYRSSEFGFTPSVTIGSMESRSNKGVSSDSRNRFTINNIGLALNLYQGTGDLTSFTLGFSYNKLADFNYRSSVSTLANNTSIADVFSNQLRGVWSEDINFDTSDPFWNGDIPINMWGSILGYNSWLVGVKDYIPNDVYNKQGMSDNTEVKHALTTFSKGSIGEYSISGGFNIRNKVYLGFTIGIQDINIKQEFEYREDYTNATPTGQDANFLWMKYGQFTELSGAGVDFKFGAIIRPIEALRIGVAVHTPKFYSLDFKYGAGMAAKLDDGKPGPVQSSIWALSNYKFNSPTRLMAGISYTIRNRAIISVDYERTWYNGMKLKGHSYIGDHQMETNSAIKREFKGTNTVRAGLEVLATRTIALRAGFSYVDSPIRGINSSLNTPVATEIYNISGGVGFELGRMVALDLTYAYVNAKYSGYEIFNYQGLNNAGGQTSVELGSGSDQIKQTLTRHNIMGTLSFRF